MKNKKSPGSDGIIAEFYKIFWNDITEFYVKSINYWIAKRITKAKHNHNYPKTKQRSDNTR